MGKTKNQQGEMIARMRQLSDELTMYSSQLREALSGGGDPPHPWHIEPWLSEYASAFKEWKTPNG